MKTFKSILMMLAFIIGAISCSEPKEVTVFSLSDCSQANDQLRIELVSTKDYNYGESTKTIIIHNGEEEQQFCEIPLWEKIFFSGIRNDAYGNCYFRDVNYDGEIDIIVGGSIFDRARLLIWNDVENRYDCYKDFICHAPIFSPSEDVIYSIECNPYDESKMVEYRRYEWNDGKLKITEKLIDVWTEIGGDLKKSNMNAKYTLVKMGKDQYDIVKIIKETNDLSELPQRWIAVITKANSDYSLRAVLTEKPQKVEKKFEKIEVNTELLDNYPTMLEEAWIDMGVESDDGKPLYWAFSNLVFRKDDTFGLANYMSYGTTFGWGDVSRVPQQSNGVDAFGGTNPPNSIVGNPDYDIVSAYLESPARMPSYGEMKRLLENSKVEKVTEHKELPERGIDGLPSWVQGQWMVQILVGNSVISRSYKIDGDEASIIDTQGGIVSPVYGGPFNYYQSDGRLLFGSQDQYLIVNEDSKTIRTSDGTPLKKISYEVRGNKVRIMKLTSNINGNVLYLPFCGYWTGTLCDDDPSMAWWLNTIGDVCLKGNKRNAFMGIRPVSTEPVKVTIGGLRRE